jgi:hypothetical protein
MELGEMELGDSIWKKNGKIFQPKTVVLFAYFSLTDFYQVVRMEEFCALSLCFLEAGW